MQQKQGVTGVVVRSSNSRHCSTSLIICVLSIIIFALLPLIFDDFLIEEANDLKVANYISFNLPSELLEEMKEKNARFFTANELIHLVKSNSSAEVFELIPVRSLHHSKYFREIKATFLSIRLWISDSWKIASILCNRASGTASYLSQTSVFNTTLDYTTQAMKFVYRKVDKFWFKNSTPVQPIDTCKKDAQVHHFNKENQFSSQRSGKDTEIEIPLDWSTIFKYITIVSVIIILFVVEVKNQQLHMITWFIDAVLSVLIGIPLGYLIWYLLVFCFVQTLAVIGCLIIGLFDFDFMEKQLKLKTDEAKQAFSIRSIQMFCAFFFCGYLCGTHTLLAALVCIINSLLAIPKFKTAIKN